MTIIATVLRTDRQSLLVQNEANGQEILVFFRNAQSFLPGERIRILFSGQMTQSIPPQITATAIQRLRPAPPSPEGRVLFAIILDRGPRSLLVQSTPDGQHFRVDYPYAHHFCPQQRVRIVYDTLTLSNPPQLTAADIRPIC